MSKFALGCDTCTFGDVSHYFCNREKKTVRIDFTYCRSCHEDAHDTIAAKLGEEEISDTEFLELLNEHGWKEVE